MAGDHFFATSDTTLETTGFDLRTLEPTGHTPVSNMGHDMFTGAHKQREIGGTATIGWSGGGRRASHSKKQAAPAAAPSRSDCRSRDSSHQRLLSRLRPRR